jgi:hypothetical protein
LNSLFRDDVITLASQIAMINNKKGPDYDEDFKMAEILEVAEGDIQISIQLWIYIN